MVADVAEQIVSAAADDVLPGAGEIIDIAYQVCGPGLLDCDGPCILVNGARYIRDNSYIRIAVSPAFRFLVRRISHSTLAIPMIITVTIHRAAYLIMLSMV